MSVDYKGGLAYGFYLTADQVKTVVKSCSDFERDVLYDSWLIPLDSYKRDWDALFAVPLRAAGPGTAVAIDRESIESGLAVQMMSDFHKYCPDIAKNTEPKFYVYTRVY